MIFDGVIAQNFRVEDDKLYRVMSQPSEDIIMNHNKELRKNEGALVDMEFGRLRANIPLNIYEAAIRCGYDLDNKDGKIWRMEMERFLNSPIGRACQVRDERKIISKQPKIIKSVL